MALYHLGIFNCKQTQMPSGLSKGRFEIIRMNCGDEETIDWTRISLEEPGKSELTSLPPNCMLGKASRIGGLLKMPKSSEYLFYPLC